MLRHFFLTIFFVQVPDLRSLPCSLFRHFFFLIGNAFIRVASAGNFQSPSNNGKLKGAVLLSASQRLWLHAGLANERGSGWRDEKGGPQIAFGPGPRHICFPPVGPGPGGSFSKPAFFIGAPSYFTGRPRCVSVSRLSPWHWLSTRGAHLMLPVRLLSGAIARVLFFTLIPQGMGNSTNKLQL